MRILESGQTIKIEISKNLWFEVKNEGWTLRVSCNQSLGVRPVSDKAIDIISFGTLNDGEEF